MPAQSQDFARMALQPPPPESYNQAYFRVLIGNIERLLRSRLGRNEQPIYWGTAFTRVTGTDNSQAVAATTNTVVAFDVLETSKDTLVIFDDTTSVFTSAAAGDLVFLVTIRNDGTLGNVRLILRKNGAMAVSAVDQTLFAGGNNIVANFAAHADAGDTFDIVIFAANAMNLDLTLSSCYVIRMSADPRLSQ